MFEVGDLIVSNEKANTYYSITKDNWRGVVLKVNENSFSARGINNEPIEDVSTSSRNETFYDLTPQYFDKI